MEKKMNERVNIMNFTFYIYSFIHFFIITPYIKILYFCHLTLYKNIFHIFFKYEKNNEADSCIQ